MATGYTILPYDTVLPEQILTHFKISVDDRNMCVCPFHNDTQASMQVNKDYVYCHGCKWAGDIWRLAGELLNTTDRSAIGRFLHNTNFPSPTGRIYRTAKYQGVVEPNLIEYWHNCLLNNGEAYIQLIHERHFSGGTISHFKLGWRPDKKAYVIPFMYHGQTDIVQFRATDTDDSGRKYWGLEGHNRGSVMNRDILDTPLPYVVILMGAFDPILAYQDGLPAVGLNGSFPFTKEDKPRVQKMFALQSIKFIVPDNNDEEIKAAHKLAQWIDGDVRTFPASLPHNTDYIDYRQAGKTQYDFKREVLGILPYDDITNNSLFVNLCALYDVGDKQHLADFHCQSYAQGISYSDVAIALANHHAKTAREKRLLYNVRDKNTFDRAMQSGYRLSGGW